MRWRAAVAATAVLALGAGAVSGPAGAAGHCSRAAADLAALHYHLESAPGEPHPAAQVLCGAFLGPGVEAMIASIRIPSCGMTGDWVLFRYAGGSWQRVFRSFEGANLAAAGPALRETQFVLRPTDAHCFPTGGTRSRTWHWNGSVFVSTPWKYSQPQAAAAAALHIYIFQSPSHNLVCDVGDEDRVYCTSANLPHTVSMDVNGVLTVCTGRKCFGGAPPKAGGTEPVLGYGGVDMQSVYRCTAETTGVTCTVNRPGTAFGKGFRIDAAGVKRIG